ncbi:MAG TPA: thiamine pyrophosphate-dependent dehydrogenase E1 component subunit alpha, partial [Acidimicrobiales bacterium]
MSRVIPDTDLHPGRAVSRHAELGLDDADVTAMYRMILLARAVDEKGWNLTRSGQARFVIPSSGQEAAQVGSAWPLRKGHDVVLPYYRDVGVVLTMGMTAHQVLLNVMARPEDPNSGGRQMPSHWGANHLGIITGSSPIATQIPHAAGVARAAQIRGEDSVTVCYFGEATASKGDFHEALNYAGIHRLPLVLVCENNEYAISVPMTLQSAVDHVADRAGAYGFGGVVVDGNDPLAVYSATRAAVDLARQGGGPTLVECKTYRLLPHTSDDDDRAYRSAQEVEAWRAKDPVTRTRDYLLEFGLLTPDDDARLCDEVQNEVDDAAKRAVDAAEAEPETAFDRVYAKPIHPIPRAPASASAGVRRPVATDAAAHPAVERSVLE